MRSVSPSSSAAPAPLPQKMTAWHSPVPYLFGGLAAMLGLISFALLLLGCSYWKLAIQSEERDLESANDEEKIKDEEQQQQQMRVYEEKILVIMAGDQKPSFLATPVTAPKVFKELGPNFGEVKELGHTQNDLQQD